mgnify:CR=1 FL=1
MILLSGIGDNLVDIISDLTNSLSTVGLQDDYLIGPTAYQMYLQMMFAAIDWLLGL